MNFFFQVKFLYEENDEDQKGNSLGFKKFDLNACYLKENQFAAV